MTRRLAVLSVAAGAANPVHAHASERKVDGGPRRLGHQPLAGRVAAQPVAELAGAMQVHAGIQADHALERARLLVADREPHGAPGVPVERASLRVAHAGVARAVEGHPRQPALEVPARAFDRVPELRSIGDVDRHEQRARRFQRISAQRGARRDRQELRDGRGGGSARHQRHSTRIAKISRWAAS
jgi:hypothetical protein